MGNCKDGENSVGAEFAGLHGLAGLDYSGLAQLASLLVLPFAHEDLAIILGAYLISHKVLPALLVGGSIYGGIIASDFALYGLGAGARRVPWLNRYADDRVQRFSATLKRNIFGLVALCRVVPGLVFVAFVACGWARVPLSQFTLASLSISALYLPLTLYIAITFGGALDEQIGWLAWPLLLGALVAAGAVRKRVFAFGDSAEAASAKLISPIANGHRGMPALAASDRGVAPAEKIPPALFYLPLVLSWIHLGIRYRSLTLPSVANPHIPTGGMWGEAKSDYFDQVAGQARMAIAAYAVLRCGENGASVAHDCARALQLMGAQNLSFPVVAKPDIGWHGYGVRLIHDREQLAAYLAAFPQNVSLLLQRFVPHDGEAAILYARMPGNAQGQIQSLALRYFPHVIGNGRSTLRDLIQNDPRARWKSQLHLGLDASHAGHDRAALERIPARGEVVQLSLIGNQRAGGLYRDGRCHITPALNDRIDAVARAMPDFHYGRFDLRFESIEALMRGDAFQIVEINGIGGEAIDAWDARLSVMETYRRLHVQQKLLFAIGDRNRARGFAPMPAADFLWMLKRQTELIQRYPASE
jgi:membrane protein DedA with SNARE-associated domain